MNIGEYELVQICGACPEQYDVYKGTQQVGYLRLRHGCFRADFMECGGETIYESSPEGDAAFAHHERMEHLTAAIHAIDTRLKQ